jgi:hypothetical protein
LGLDTAGGILVRVVGQRSSFRLSFFIDDLLTISGEDIVKCENPLRNNLFRDRLQVERETGATERHTD